MALAGWPCFDHHRSMVDIPDVASIAALIAEPTRARMLAWLMDGRARTATELALEGGVTASTTSSHLTRLTAAGLLAERRQGRHRYFSIRSPEVAAAIEGLMSIAPRRLPASLAAGPRDERLRRARSCYDHLAGELGVELYERLRQHGFVAGSDDALALTARGEAWCKRIGLDLAALRQRRRPLCRPCLDWSERRAHLGGSLGAALFVRLLALRLARRDPHGRAVALSSRGEAFVNDPDRGV